MLPRQIDHRAAALALDRDDVAAADDLGHARSRTRHPDPWPPIVVDARSSCWRRSRSPARATTRRRACRRGRAPARQIGFRMRPEPERARLARDLGTARDALGDDATTKRRRGSGHALARRRHRLRAARRGERKRPSHGWDGLTPTERQVADLALGGLTNAEIAERLFIGRETVKTHLSNIYAKVGVANRTQLVADAARRGIT